MTGEQRTRGLYQTTKPRKDDMPHTRVQQSNLAELHVDSNKLGEKSAVALARLVNLETLDVSYNK